VTRRLFHPVALLLCAGCASSGAAGPSFLRFTVNGTEYAYYQPAGRRDGAGVMLLHEDWVRSGRLTLRFPVPSVAPADPYPLTFAAYLPASGGEYSTDLGGGGSVRLTAAPSCRTETTPPGDFMGAPVGGTARVCRIAGSFTFVAYGAAGDSVMVTDGEFRLDYF
jgi:hypothetical protein